MHKTLSLWKWQLAGRLLHFLCKMLYATCRFRIIDQANSGELSQKGGFILATWHNRLAAIEPFLLKCMDPGGTYSMVVSESKHGELLVAANKFYPQARFIRVPKREKHLSLKKMLNALKRNEIILITADGSKGPRYKVQRGTAFAARQTGAPIVPFSFCATRFWQTKSWDKMIIPKPFSTIHIHVGKPLFLSPDEKADTKSNAELIQKQMLATDTAACLATSDDPDHWPK